MMKQVVILGLLVLALGWARAVGAQGANRAGLVIQYGDGAVETACVPFAEPDISGLQLLQRSGLPMTYDAQAGATVCSIRQEGCLFPANGCFCQCATIGAGCTYWSYHLLGPDRAWQYSALGAAGTRARPGEVHGWRWGTGGASDAPPPAAVTFEQICAAPEPTAIPPTPVLPTPAPAPMLTATRVPATVTREATPTVGPDGIATASRAAGSGEWGAESGAVAEADVTATAFRVPTITKRATIEPTIVPTNSVTPAPSATVATVTPAPIAPPVAATGGLPRSYLVFGVLALVLAGGIVWARRG